MLQDGQRSPAGIEAAPRAMVKRSIRSDIRAQKRHQMATGVGPADVDERQKESQREAEAQWKCNGYQDNSGNKTKILFVIMEVV